jgi:hypothetical protein
MGKVRVVPTPRPYTSYAGIVAGFAGLVAAAGLAERASGRDPRARTALDFAILSAASFKAARALAHENVTSFIREPFVRGEDEQPVHDGGIHQAVGELVTCTRCVGTWASAGLSTAQIVFPRSGRILTWSLAAAGVNDFLQAGFAALTAKANEREEPAV